MSAGDVAGSTVAAGRSGRVKKRWPATTSVSLPSMAAIARARPRAASADSVTQGELGVEHHACGAAGDGRGRGVQADAALGPDGHADVAQLLEQHERLGVTDAATGLAALGDQAGGARGDRGVGLGAGRDGDEHPAWRPRFDPRGQGGRRLVRTAGRSGVEQHQLGLGGQVAGHLDRVGLDRGRGPHAEGAGRAGDDLLGRGGGGGRVGDVEERQRTRTQGPDGQADVRTSGQLQDQRLLPIGDVHRTPRRVRQGQDGVRR